MISKVYSSLFGPSFTAHETTWLCEVEAHISLPPRTNDATNAALIALRAQAESIPTEEPLSLAIRDVVVKKLIRKSHPNDMLNLIKVTPSRYFKSPEMVELSLNTINYEERIVHYCIQVGIRAEDVLSHLRFLSEYSPFCFVSNYERFPILSAEQALPLLRIVAKKISYVFAVNYQKFPPLPPEAADILLVLFQDRADIFVEHLLKHLFMLEWITPEQKRAVLKCYVAGYPQNFAENYEKFSILPTKSVNLLRTLFENDCVAFTKNLWKYPFMLDHLTPDKKKSMLWGFAQHITLHPLLHPLVPAEVQRMALVEVESLLLPSVDDVTYATVLALLLPLLPADSITYEMAFVAVKIKPLLLQFVPAAIQAQEKYSRQPSGDVGDLLERDSLAKSIIYTALDQDPRTFKFIEPEFLTQKMLDYMIITHKNTARHNDLVSALMYLADLMDTQPINFDLAYPLAIYFNNYKKVMLSLIAKYGVDFLSASDELRADYDVVFVAIHQDPSALNDALGGLRYDPTLIAYAKERRCVLGPC